MKITISLNGNAQDFRRLMQRNQGQQSQWLLKDKQPSRPKNAKAVPGTNYVFAPLEAEYEEIKEYSKWEVRPYLDQAVFIVAEATDFGIKALIDISGEIEPVVKEFSQWVKGEIIKVGMLNGTEIKSITGENPGDFGKIYDYHDPVHEMSKAEKLEAYLTWTDRDRFYSKPYEQWAEIKFSGLDPSGEPKVPYDTLIGWNRYTKR